MGYQLWQNFLGFNLNSLSQLWYKPYHTVLFGLNLLWTICNFKEILLNLQESALLESQNHWDLQNDTSWQVNIIFQHGWHLCTVTCTSILIFTLNTWSELLRLWHSIRRFNSVAATNYLRNYLWWWKFHWIWDGVLQDKH